MAEKPWVLYALEYLLWFLRLLSALGVVPSYCCLLLCQSIVCHEAFSEKGHSGKHAALALPRVLALTIGVPFSFFGLACGAEVLVHHAELLWPVGLGAAFGFVMTLHGLWFFHHRPGTPHNCKLQLSRIVHSVPDAVCDFAACCALAFVCISLIRLPSLIKELWVSSCSDARSSGRRAIFWNALMVFVELLCLPAWVTVSILAWRLPLACRDYQALNTSTLKRRGSLVLHAFGGLIDLPFICMALIAAANPFRLACMWKEIDLSNIGACRWMALKHVVGLICDVMSLCLLALLVPLPWRLVWAVRDTCKTRQHLAVAFHVVRAPLDVFAILAALMVLPSHRCFGLPIFSSSEKQYAWGNAFGESSGFPSGQLQVFHQLRLLCVDVIACAFPIALVILTFYRIPTLIHYLRSNTEGTSRSYYKLIWLQLLYVLLDVPHLVLTIVSLLVPWRLLCIVRDAFLAPSAQSRRGAVRHHFFYGICDVFALVAFVLMLALAPHRLCLCSFWRRLYATRKNLGLSYSHGPRAPLDYARPEPPVPEEGSTIVAYHGTSASNANAIQRDGFQPSRTGMLGPGVYISRDLSKAESYGDGTILELRVTLGKIVVIDRQGHPDQQDWHSKGFDIAWVVAGSDVVPSKREEGCVAEPTRIEVARQFHSARRNVELPQLVCLRQAFGGFVDVALCGVPMLLLLLSVYRLPLFVRAACAPGATACEIRRACLGQALSLVMDVPAIIVSIIMIGLSPWRLAVVIAYCARHREASLRRWECYCQAAMGFVDIPCAIAMVLLVLTGYRLPEVIKRIQAIGGYFHCGPLSVERSGRFEPQRHVLQQGLELFMDLPFMVLACVVMLLLLRARELITVTPLDPKWRMHMCHLFVTVVADIFTFVPLTIVLLTMYRFPAVVAEIRAAISAPSTSEPIIRAQKWRVQISEDGNATLQVEGAASQLVAWSCNQDMHLWIQPGPDGRLWEEVTRMAGGVAAQMARAMIPIKLQQGTHVDVFRLPESPGDAAVTLRYSLLLVLEKLRRGMPNADLHLQLECTGLRSCDPGEQAESQPAVIASFVLPGWAAAEVLNEEIGFAEGSWDISSDVRETTAPVRGRGLFDRLRPHAAVWMQCAFMLIDLVFMVFLILIVCTLVRLPFLLMRLKGSAKGHGTENARDVPSKNVGWHRVVIEELLALVFTLPYLPLICMILVSPWRFPTMYSDLQRKKDEEGKSLTFPVILFHAATAWLDWIALPCGLLFCITAPHRVPYFAYHVSGNASNSFFSNWRNMASILLLQQLGEGLVDLCLCGLPFMLLVLTVYRLPLLLRATNSPDATTCAIRRQCLFQAFCVLRDLVFALLVLFVLVTGLRARQLLRRLKILRSSDSGRTPTAEASGKDAKQDLPTPSVVGAPAEHCTPDPEEGRVDKNATCGSEKQDEACLEPWQQATVEEFVKALLGLPFVPLVALLILTPWRLMMLRSDLRHRRQLREPFGVVILFHFACLFIDLFVIPLALLLLLTAPHRVPRCLHKLWSEASCSYFVDRDHIGGVIVAQEVAGGFIDFSLCLLPLLVLLITIYRLPRLLRAAKAPNATAWSVRATCVWQARCVCRDAIFAMLCFVIIVSGIRMIPVIQQLVELFRGDESCEVEGDAGNKDKHAVADTPVKIAEHATDTVADAPGKILEHEKDTVADAPGEISEHEKDVNSTHDSSSVEVSAKSQNANGVEDSIGERILVCPRLKPWQKIVLQEFWQLLCAIVLDIILCGPFWLLLVVTVYRLPNVINTMQSKDATIWNVRSHCMSQAFSVLKDAVAVLACIFILLSPWRFVALFVELRRMSETNTCTASKRRICFLQAGMALVDPLCLVAFIMLLITGYRVPALRLELRASGGYFSCAPAKAEGGSYQRDAVDYFVPQANVLKQGVSLLADLPFLMLSLVALCSWRCPTLLRSLARVMHPAMSGEDLPPLEASRVMNRALGMARIEAWRAVALIFSDLVILISALFVVVLVLRVPSLVRRTYAMAVCSNLMPVAGDAAQSTRTGDETFNDIQAGMSRLRQLDGAADGSEKISLTFFQVVVFEELALALRSLPKLLLLPVIILICIAGPAYYYANRRFGEPQTAEGQETAQGQTRKFKSKCFLAVPVTMLLKAAPPGPKLADIERYALVHLATFLGVLLHELAVLLALLFYFAILAPLTLGFALWPAGCCSTRVKDQILVVCHTIQGMTLVPVLVLSILAAFVPGILWLQPQGEWLQIDPFSLSRPLQVVMHDVALWVVQGVWIVVYSGAIHLLALGPLSDGAYRPLRGTSTLVWQLLGVVIGHSIIWVWIVDPVVGGCVRICYRHRRTCGCFGEVFLSVVLCAFFAWPLSLPLLFASGAHVTGIVTWWVVSSILSLFFLSHSVRITRAHWGEPTPSVHE